APTRCYLEARGLGDRPLGQEAAVAISADRQLVGIGDALFYESIDAFKNVFTRPRVYSGHESKSEGISITGRASVVRVKNQPAFGSCVNHAETCGERNSSPSAICGPPDGAQRSERKVRRSGFCTI